MATESYRLTPPPYRPNRMAKTGFIISLVCAGLLTGGSIFLSGTLFSSDTLRLCFIVSLVFIILLAAFALILSLSGIKKTPKVFAILGTVISSVVILDSIISLLSQIFNFSFYSYLR